MNTRLIKMFCKSNKTANEKMSSLYELFLTQKYSPHGTRKCLRPVTMPRGDFELGLLSLGSKVARLAGEKCLRYPEDQYEKFILEQEKVSKDFWDYVHSIGKSNTLEPVVPPPVPVSSTTEPKASPQHEDLVTKKEISLEEAEKKCYEGLLPINWAMMSFPQKVDFTKKVYHKGFREYICAQDKKIDNFFLQAKDKSGGATNMPIYVTLFSFPSDNYSVEAKGLLKMFVGILNDVGRAKLQYVEYNEPTRTVEIREVRG